MQVVKVGPLSAHFELGVIHILSLIPCGEMQPASNDERAFPPRGCKRTNRRQEERVRAGPTRTVDNSTESTGYVPRSDGIKMENQVRGTRDASWKRSSSGTRLGMKVTPCIGHQAGNFLKWFRYCCSSDTPHTENIAKES